MSENPFKELDSDDPSFSLTIKDRMPYTYILTEAIKTVLKSISSMKYTRREIEESIQALVKMIPASWTNNDEEWEKDMAKATTKVTVDIRPTFAAVKMSERLCKKRGIPMTKEVEIPDYFQMLHAVFNKLNRLGMISRREWVEAPTGMPPGEKPLPEGMNLQEYLDSQEKEMEAKK
jgi:hypothetical protein